MKKQIIYNRKKIMAHLINITSISICAILILTNMSPVKISAENQKQKPKEINRDGRYIAFNDGTVLDSNNSLMWAEKDNGIGINWFDAIKYCENFRGGGYDDWRMPTLEELKTLYNKNEPGSFVDCGCKKANCLKVHITKLINLSCCCPWVSGASGGSTVKFFNLWEGRIFWYPPNYSDLSRALPVRRTRWAKDKNTGCILWNPNPKPNETVTWSGKCVDGYGEGYGIKRWFTNGVETSSYKGEMHAGKAHGKGEVKYTKYSKHLKYIGDFLDGKKHGHGVILFKNGTQYNGNFVNGKKHGKGIFFNPDGSSYEAMFRDGIRIK